MGIAGALPLPHLSGDFLPLEFGQSRSPGSGLAGVLTGVGATGIIPVPVAGWSSLVARRAHNPKVAGSNPAPAINGEGKGTPPLAAFPR